MTKRQPASQAAPPAPTAQEWTFAAKYTLKNSKGYQRNADKLERNPRIGMAYRQLAKMPPEEVAALQAQAIQTREQLGAL